MSSLLSPRNSKGAKSDTPSASLCARIVASISPLQQKFLLDPARFKIARCGRRGGKTYVDAALLLYTTEKFEKSNCVYFGLTRDSAKAAIWQTLVDMVETFKIDAEVSESTLTITRKNGSSIRLFGADLQNMADRFRGRKFKMIVVDEIAFFTKVDNLITSVLLPTLADARGSLILTSSPGPIASGMFYEADQGDQKERWSRYNWTLLDNPHFQRPAEDPQFANAGEEELDTICKMRFGGDREHPEFLREYMGQWTFSRRSLAYPLKPEQIIPAALPLHSTEYAIGLNLSQFGKQSFCVIKFSEYARAVQVVESVETKCNNLALLASTIQTYLDRYKVDFVQVYLGPHKAEIVEEFVSRYDLPLRVNEYEKLPFYQSIIATDMDAGYVQLVASNGGLAKEFAKIVQDDDGAEAAGQTTLLADSFFVAYMNLYSTRLKHIKPPESDEDKMIRQLTERYQEPTGDNQDDYDFNS